MKVVNVASLIIILIGLDWSFNKYTDWNNHKTYSISAYQRWHLWWRSLYANGKEKTQRIILE